MAEYEAVELFVDFEDVKSLFKIWF